MGSIIGFLSSLLTVIKTWMGWKEKAEDQADALRRAELESRDKQDEKKGQADEIWDSPDSGPIDLSNRMRRHKPDGPNKD